MKFSFCLLSQEIFVQQTFLGKWFHYGRKGTLEQRGSSIWVRFHFTVTPTISCPFISYPFYRSLPSVSSCLTPEEDLHVLPPTRMYSKTLIPFAVTPVPIHADSPSASFQMSAIQPYLWTIFQVFKVTFIPSVILLFCSELHLESWLCFRMKRFIRVLQLFYWFSCITKRSLNLVTMSVFSGSRVPSYHWN
jgi:hypothetical protein